MADGRDFSERTNTARKSGLGSLSAEEREVIGTQNSSDR